MSPPISSMSDALAGMFFAGGHDILKDGRLPAMYNDFRRWMEDKESGWHMFSDTR